MKPANELEAVRSVWPQLQHRWGRLTFIGI